MGTVYLVHDRQKGESIALKLLREDLQREKDLQRLREEFEALSRLDHPGIVKVYDFGSNYFTMEYVPGKGLDEELGEEGIPRVIDIATDICRTLDYFHCEGIIHRDLKPANIRVTPDGTVKLMDFGFALTHDLARSIHDSESNIAGSIEYMAPELIKGFDVDPRADIYSIGVTFYQLATGRLPFTSRDLMAAVMKQLESKAVAPSKYNRDVTPGFESILLRCLEKDPADRYQTAQELLMDLVQLSGRSEIAAIRTEKGARYLYRPRFVGRESLLAKIRESFVSCRRGACRGVLVRGVTGVGKTRILEEVRGEWVAEPVILAHVSCSEHHEAPFESLVILAQECLLHVEQANPDQMPEIASRWGGTLVHFLPELGRRSWMSGICPEGDISPERLAHELVGLFSYLSESQPVVLLLDDLDRLGEEDFDTLLQLVEAVVDRPVLLLASSTWPLPRGGKEHPVELFLPKWRALGILEEIDIGPLSQEDLRSFLGSMIYQKEITGFLPEAISELSDGNPALAEETMYGLAEDGLIYRRGGEWQIEVDDVRKIRRPLRSENSLPDRVLELEKKDRLMLSALALVGSLCDLGLLMKITRLKESQAKVVLGNLESAELCESISMPEGLQYRSVFPQLRDLCPWDAKGRALQKLHDRIATYLEGREGEQEESELENLAHHYRGSRRPDRAVDVYIDLGDRFRKAYLTQRAASYYETGIEVAEALGDDERRALIQGKLGSLYNRGGDFDRAIRFYNRALTGSGLTENSRDQSLQGLGYAHFRKHQYNEALRCFKRLLEESKDQQVRPDVLNHISRIYLARGQLGRSERYAQEALELVRGTGREILLASIYGNLGDIHFFQGRFSTSINYLERALDLLPPEGEGYLRSRISAGIARVHLHYGDLEVTYKFLEDALYHAQFTGDRVYMVEIEARIGQIFEWDGRLDRAQEVYEQAIERSQEMGRKSSEAYCGLNLGRLLVKKGQASRAVEYLVKSMRTFKDTRVPWAVGICYIHLGEAFADEGLYRKAKTSFAMAEKTLRDVQMKWLLGTVYSGVVDVLIKLGNHGLALKTLNKALDRSKDLDLKNLQGILYRKYALFCIANNYRLEAVEHFVASLVLLGRTRSRFEEGRTHLAYGGFLLETEKAGDRGYLKSAVNHLRKARDIFEDAGADHLLGKAQMLLGESLKAREEIYHRFDLADRSRALSDEIGSLQLEVTDSFNDILEGIRAEVKLMNAEELILDVERRIRDSEEALAQKLQALEGKNQSLLAEVEELRDERTGLLALQKVTKVINSTLDSERLFQMVLDLVVEVIRAERGFLMLRDENEGFVFKAARNLEKEQIDHPEFEVSTSIVHKVIRTGDPVLTSDAQADGEFQAESIRNLRLKSILCVPFTLKGKTIGAMYVDNPSIQDLFTDRDLDLLVAFADQVAIALENAFLYEELVEKQKIEQELNIASRIQANLLPKVIPQIAGLEVYGKMVPAGKVGGDYYDFLLSEDQKSLLSCIGDVSGKGVPAGLVMVMARVLLHHLSESNLSTRDVLLEANRILKANTEPFVFMSMLLVRWDGESICYTGAGHENLLVYRSQTETVEAIPAGGVVLGIKDEVGDMIQEKQLDLSPGDVVLLYTDGCSEALNSEEAMFEVDRLKESLKRHVAKDVGELVESVFEDIEGFVGDAEQHDDMTLTVLKRV
jgi:serine phosphatase RsbU (regulator of sigma subunit)/predicted ATPase/predicted Ser/Thr protein kinase